MFNFDYYNPIRVIFGKDRLDSIDKYVPADAKVLITYGGGSAKRNGLIDKVNAVLGKRKVFEFGGIEANPHYETLVKGIEIVKNENIDFLLAVGGGSVIDGTKFIALASCYYGTPSNLFTAGFPVPYEVVGKAIPFGTVVTLPASGSEVTNGAVITYGNGKLPVHSDLVIPKFSILDPTLTFTLPKTQVANGVIDAFAHVIEQYLTYPVDARVQDRIAEGVLQTLIEIGETTVNEPENYDARANHVRSATMAMIGVIGIGVPWDLTSHFIGHELTSLFGIDHGKTLAVVLPSVMEVRREQKHAKLVQYAERVWHITNGSEDEKIDLAIRKTRGFFESLGVKTHLSDYGVETDKIPAVVELLKEHGLTAISRNW